MELIIHQVWVGPFTMPQRVVDGIQRIKDAHPQFEHRMWTNANVPAMPAHVQAAFDKWMAHGDYAFACDVLRFWLVHEFGGVYLDADFVPLAGLSGLNLENHGAFLCNHVGRVETFPNGVFGMAKHSKLSTLAVDAIHPVNNWCGPSWLGPVVKSYFKELAADITHEELQPLLEAEGWLVLNFDLDLQARYLRHDALASWFPENRQKLIDGTA